MVEDALKESHYYMLFHGTRRYSLVSRDERLADQLERVPGIIYLGYMAEPDARTAADRKLQTVQSIQRNLSRRRSSGGAYG